MMWSMNIKQQLFCYTFNFIHRLAYMKVTNQTEESESVNESPKQSKDSIIIFVFIIIALVVITIILSVFSFTRGRVKGRSVSQMEKSEKSEKSNEIEKSEKIDKTEKSENSEKSKKRINANKLNTQSDAKEELSKSSTFISIKNWKSHLRIPNETSQTSVRSDIRKDLKQNYENDENSIESIASIEGRKQYDLQKYDKRNKRLNSQKKWGLHY